MAKRYKQIKNCSGKEEYCVSPIVTVKNASPLSNTGPGFVHSAVCVYGGGLFQLGRLPVYPP